MLILLTWYSAHVQVVTDGLLQVMVHRTFGKSCCQILPQIFGKYTWSQTYMIWKSIKLEKKFKNQFHQMLTIVCLKFNNTNKGKVIILSLCDYINDSSAYFPRLMCVLCI